MDMKKLAPWNWFKDEEESHSYAPATRTEKVHPTRLADPAALLHKDMDTLFSRLMEGYGMHPKAMDYFFGPTTQETLLRPKVDINADEHEYSITVEIPGISQKDIKLEIEDNSLTIAGEKRQEAEDKSKGYYRMERSYGTFQRRLSLPEDADQGKIDASFTDGILTIRLPRKEVSTDKTKQIQIK